MLDLFPLPISLVTFRTHSNRIEGSAAWLGQLSQQGYHHNHA